MAAGLAFMFSIAASAADVNGTWTWTTPGRQGGPDRKNTLTLKVEGEKVTGKLSAPGRQGATTEINIEDGKLKKGDEKGDEISFKVTREFQGNKRVSKYSGKVAGDVIKGKFEFEGQDGQAQSREWEAKREKAK